MISVTKYGVTIGYIDTLQILLVALKLQGHINVSWLLVLSPYILLVIQSIVILWGLLKDELDEK